MRQARPYEEDVKDIAVYVREELKGIESISSMSLDIEISGRVHDGELKIKFTLGSTYSSSGSVSGGNIEAVLLEYKRRFGWDKRHQPLELTFVPTPEVKQEPAKSLVDEEIPF